MKLEDEIIAEGMVAVGGSVGVEVLGERGTMSILYLARNFHYTNGYAP